MIYIIASAIIVLFANRVGYWIDKQPGEDGWYEMDMTVWGIVIASLAYLAQEYLVD